MEVVEVFCLGLHVFCLEQPLLVFLGFHASAPVSYLVYVKHRTPLRHREVRKRVPVFLPRPYGRLGEERVP